MNTLQKLFASSIGVAVIAASATPANAFSLSFGGQSAGADGYKTTVQGATTIDFNGGTAPTFGVISYSSKTSTPTIVSGSLSGQYATPSGDTTSYLTISPQGSSVKGATGDVTLSFAHLADYFGLYWGSVDTYNFLDFYKGDTLLKTFSGTDVSNTAKGSWTGPSDNVFIDFFAGQGESFDKVVMRSNGTAFETDNHAYREAKSVPEPSITLGLAVVGLFGASTLRKRQRAQAVAMTR